METVRFKFKRTRALRFLSHLDQQRVFQRAFRRGAIPMAYSNGFNPHPRVAFAQAMPVGMTSDGEYGDIVLSEDMAPDAFTAAINAALPEGLVVTDAWVLPEGHISLTASVTSASYEVKMPGEARDGFSIDDALGRFLEQKEIVIDKRNKKGKMVKKDIRPYIGAMTVEKAEPAGFRFALDLKFVEQQCVKPEIVLGTFQEMFKDDLHFENASSIHRKHLNIVD